jgi:hypothetical protein
MHISLIIVGAIVVARVGWRLIQSRARAGERGS